MTDKPEDGAWRYDASGGVWSDAERRRKTRASYGPHPKPNTCPVPHHLRDVPQERFGYPVPWVSDWTGTRGAPTRWIRVPKHEHWGRYNASEAGIGEGYALAGLLHPGRQITAMAKRLCGVCGKGIQGKALLIGGPNLITQGFHEPPVHRNCARYAIQACPGINKGHSVVVEARGYTCHPIWGDGDGRTYHDRDAIPLPFRWKLPVVSLTAKANPDSTVYTMAAWARHTKVCPHPDLEGGFPEWNLSDLKTHPDYEPGVSNGG